MIEYGGYFMITLLLSFLFALGGVGSAVALVPMLDMIGLSFNLAKVTALFVNTSTTVTASVMNLKRKVLDIRFAFPLVITSMLMSPLGAHASRYVDEAAVKWMLVLFLLFSATMIVFAKKEAKYRYESSWILYGAGSVVGFISGILGVGGGSLIMPLMILLGYDAKKMAIAVSFMVPFSTFSAFLAYTSFVTIDWTLLVVTAIAAVIGGYVGNRIMHFRLDSAQIKRVIGLILYLLAFRMTYTLLQ